MANFQNLIDPVSMAGNDLDAKDYKPRGMPRPKFYMDLFQSPKSKQAGKS